MVIDLILECVNILLVIMSLTNVKYHIPGETFERNRIRQKGQDSGILIIVMFTYLRSMNETVKKYIYEEFLSKLEEPDIEYHFENNHSNYAIVSDFIQDAETK